MEFDWDPRKAGQNQSKHSVSFEEAISVFFDENALLITDPEHSEKEDRFVLMGLSYRFRVLVVVHTYRRSEQVIRLISARKATKQEQQTYNESLS